MWAAVKRDWYLRNKEKVAASVRAYYEKNKVAINARQKAFRDANKALFLVRQRDYRARNKEKIARMERDGKLRKAYGISVVAWDEMFLAQGRQCAICHGTEHGGRGWSTDHDHSTGEVRGILCHRCNIGLGYFNDSPEAARSAAEYLMAGQRKKGRK